MYRVTEKADEIKDLLDDIGDRVNDYTLADAIAESDEFFEHTTGWGDGYKNSCSLTGAFAVAKARGFLE